MITAKDAFPKTEDIQFRHIQPNLAPSEDIYSKGKKLIVEWKTNFVSVTLNRGRKCGSCQEP